MSRNATVIILVVVIVVAVALVGSFAHKRAKAGMGSTPKGMGPGAGPPPGMVGPEAGKGEPPKALQPPVNAKGTGPRFPSGPPTPRKGGG